MIGLNPIDRPDSTGQPLDAIYDGQFLSLMRAGSEWEMTGITRPDYGGPRMLADRQAMTEGVASDTSVQPIKG